MGNNLTILKMLSKPKAKPFSRVVITGGSSGIGRQIAFQYSKRQYRLIISGRNQQQLIETVSECRHLGSTSVDYIVCDVNSKQDCQVLINKSVEKLGGIDILVLSAGVSAHQLFEQAQSTDIYHQLMNTNFFGYLYCTFAAFQHLKLSKGQIVVISSISGQIGLPYRTAYCSSKFAVTGFFESLRSQLDQNQIAISIVCPPSVKTNLRANSLIKVEGTKENEHVITVEDCVEQILAATDRRARKMFFPLKVYFAAYVRPFFPDWVDHKLKRAAKL